MLCTLENKNDVFSSGFVDKFTGLDMDNEYEFEIIKQSSPCVVRLYVNGDLFSDGDCKIPKNGQIERNGDSMSIVNGIIKDITESSDQRRVANEIVTEIVENSLNETDATDNGSTTITDIVSEADRINKVHFKSIENSGMGFVPSNA